MNKLNRYVNVPLIVVAIVFGVVFFAQPQRQANAADIQINLHSGGTAVGISGENGSYAYYATPVYHPAPAVVVNPRPYPAPQRRLPPPPPRHYVPRYLPPQPPQPPLPPEPPLPPAPPLPPYAPLPYGFY